VDGKVVPPLSQRLSSSFDEVIAIGLRVQNTPWTHDREGGTGTGRDDGGSVADPTQRWRCDEWVS
jgi:hypothetical protein